jgi:hypothetical protein
MAIAADFTAVVTAQCRLAGILEASSVVNDDDVSPSSRHGQYSFL